MWRNPASLDYGQITSFLGNYRDFSISITGGEPFLYGDIYRLIKYCLKRALKNEITSIHISSNGTCSEMRDFVVRFAPYAKWLEMTFSVDGIGKYHDLQRGCDGAFRSLIDNVKFVRRVAPELSLSIKMVITSINQDQIYRVWELAKLLKVPVYFKVVEAVPSYYHRNYSLNIEDLMPDLSLVKFTLGQIAGEYEKLFGESDHGIYYAYLERIIAYLESGKMDFITTCRTPIHSFFVTVDGNIFPCLYMEPVGNIASGIDGDKLDSIRKRASIGDCPKCLAYHGYLQWWNFV